MADAFWWCYEAETKRAFAQRWRAFVDRCAASTEWLPEWLPERIIEKIKRAEARKLPFYKAWYSLSLA